MLLAAPRASLMLPSGSPNYLHASGIGWTRARHCPFLKLLMAPNKCTLLLAPSLQSLILYVLLSFPTTSTSEEPVHNHSLFLLSSKFGNHTFHYNVPDLSNIMGFIAILYCFVDISNCLPDVKIITQTL